MLPFLTGIKTKLLVFGIVGICIAAFFTHRYFETKNMLDQIQALQTENAQLVTSNTTLQETVRDQNNQFTAVVKSLEELRTSDQKTRKSVQRVVNHVMSAETEDRLTSIKESRKREWLRNIMNRNIQCEVEHFTDAGKCVNGKWQAEQDD